MEQYSHCVYVLGRRYGAPPSLHSGLDMVEVCGQKLHVACALSAAGMWGMWMGPEAEEVRQGSSLRIVIIKSMGPLAAEASLAT